MFFQVTAEAKDIICSLEGYSRDIRVQLSESAKSINFHNQLWAYENKAVLTDLSDLTRRLLLMTSFANYSTDPAVRKYTGIDIGQGRHIDLFEVEGSGKKEWVFFGNGLILNRCIEKFEAGLFQIDHNSLEQGRKIALDILEDAIVNASNPEVFSKLKESLVNVEFTFGDCYSKTAIACVNFKYMNAIRFNSQREIPIDHFYGSYTDPLLVLAQTIIHETSHTLGYDEIEATQNELDVFVTASKRIPSFNSYAIKYKIMPLKH